jgi:hypothetical protein
MGAHNLYSLISDRLLIYADKISISLYNTLYEVKQQNSFFSIYLSPNLIY